MNQPSPRLPPASSSRHSTYCLCQRYYGNTPPLPLLCPTRLLLLIIPTNVNLSTLFTSHHHPWVVAHCSYYHPTFILPQRSIFFNLYHTWRLPMTGKHQVVPNIFISISPAANHPSLSFHFLLLQSTAEAMFPTKCLNEDGLPLI